MCNLAALTLNRYIKICHYDIYSRIYSGFNVALMIIFIWLFSFGFTSLPLFEIWGKFGLCPTSNWCTILPKNGHSPLIFFIFLAFILPCILIIACNCAIFLKMQNMAKELLKCLPNARSTYTENDLQLLKMMVTIFAIFLICFLPTVIINAFDGPSIHSILKYPDLHVFASIIFWVIPVSNPFIYAFKNKIYRPAFVNMYQKILCFDITNQPNPKLDIAIRTPGGTTKKKSNIKARPVTCQF